MVPAPPLLHSSAGDMLEGTVWLSLLASQPPPSQLIEKKEKGGSLAK